ncbi:MAG: GNAT family N-acetyltransferase [Chitinivibrionales bacterium]|nr:GNAT family N-acetyltransferase [Chitinivibrionales bacterium]
MMPVRNAVRKAGPLQAMRRMIPLDRIFSKQILLKIDRYKPNIRFQFDNSKYFVKIAETGDELKKALKLRHKVFYEEILHRRKLLGIDLDKFDFKCDHLLMFEKESSKLIGTYRFNCSSFTNNFYSSTEFNIKNILALPGIKMELGRACIRREFRTNFTIALLWKGITEYVQATGSQYLFGCSSIHTLDVGEIARFYCMLKEKEAWTDEFRVRPKAAFKIKHFKKKVAEIVATKGTTDADNAEIQIPPLIRFYLKAGAKLCGDPIIDKDFQCADFFTLMNMENLSKEVDQKFRVQK